MKRIGLLALAVVLSLGLLGVGFAHWAETLTIEGTADTGNFIVTFDNGGGDDWEIPSTHQVVDLRGLVSNDDAVSDQAIWCNGVLLVPVVPDPDDLGGDPTGPQTMGQNVNRLGDYASTTVTSCGVGDPIVRDVMVTMENAYPSYWPTVFFSIRNWGTIPAKIQSITLIQVSKDPTPENPTSGDEIVCPVSIPLEECVYWYVHFDQVAGTCEVNDDEECAAFSLHLSDDYHRLSEVLAAGSGTIGDHGQYESAVCGNLDIHVLQHAEELALYDFVIEIVALPFNKVL